MAHDTPKAPTPRREVPTPVLIKNAGQQPVTNVQFLIDRLDQGSVPFPRYSFVANNIGPTTIAVNTVIIMASSTGVRNLLATDDIHAHQLLLSLTSVAAGLSDTFYQFGVFNLDLGQVFANDEVLYVDRTDGTIDSFSADHDVAVLKVLGNTGGTFHDIWFEPSVFNIEESLYNRGIFDPNLPFGGPLVRHPIQNGETGYREGDYLVVRNGGAYNFATGQPDAGGTTVPQGARVYYNQGTTDFSVVSPDSFMRGFFDPSIAGGGLTDPVIDGTANYSTDQYVVALIDGRYDFVTGLPVVAGGEVITSGDRVIYDGAVWSVLGIPANAFRGFFDPGTNNGGAGVPFPIINGSLNYQANDYVFATQSANYDFVTGLTGTGTPIVSGSRVIYDGAVWIQITASNNGLHKGWFDPTQASGGVNVDFPVVNGSVNYLINEFVEADAQGTYNFATGLPDAAGTAVEPGDIFRFDAINFNLEVKNQGLSRGFMDATINNGGIDVPWSIVDATTQYLDDEYIIVSVAGAYDFTTGLAGTGIDLNVGDVVRYIGGLWVPVTTVFTAQTVSEAVNQVAHGFTLAQHVYLSAGGVWTLAISSAQVSLKQGMVSSVIDVDNFVVTHYGQVTLTAHGLALAATFFLDDAIAGGHVITAPVAATSFVQVVFEVQDANTVFVLDQAVIANSAPIVIPPTSPDNRVVLTEFAIAGAVDFAAGLFRLADIPDPSGRSGKFKVYVRDNIGNAQFFEVAFAATHVTGVINATFSLGMNTRQGFLVDEIQTGFIGGALAFYAISNTNQILNFQVIFEQDAGTPVSLLGSNAGSTNIYGSIGIP